MSMNIHSKLRDYEIEFCRDTSFFEKIAAISPKIIVVDRNVYNNYQDLFGSHFAANEVVIFEAREDNKNMTGVLNLCDKVMEYAAKKNMTIVSFGGGITQDVTGFLSSILYRGVNWVFVPTTLLAQADSCMGSKTSLNHKKYKNLLGDFYPPSKIYLNVSFTKTLDERNFYCGVGEIVKLHLMGGREMATHIQNVLADGMAIRNDMTALEDVVKNSLQVKYDYIKDDEFDTGRRNLLNFGHCFGHAFETSSDYAVPHGIAVTIGMIFANEIAMRRGLLDAGMKSDLERFLLTTIKCEIKACYFDKNRILSAIKMDKKRVGKGLPLIVLKTDYSLEKLLDMTEQELFTGIDAILPLMPK